MARMIWRCQCFIEVLYDGVPSEGLIVSTLCPSPNFGSAQVNEVYRGPMVLGSAETHCNRLHSQAPVFHAFTYSSVGTVAKVKIV